jgi:hypothetical protein
MVAIGPATTIVTPVCKQPAPAPATISNNPPAVENPFSARN